MIKIVMVAALIVAQVPANAQWLNFKTPGIPRLTNGKVNLSAAVPRTADGKPDLSGMWQAEINQYRLSVTQDLEEEKIFRPQAQAIFRERLADFRKEDPTSNCLPNGIVEMISYVYRIVQAPNMIAVLMESGTGRYRQIYMDGRKLPEDPNPTWLGYSIARWDQDTLVVESTGFNDKTWLDRAGHPHSEKLRVTEKFRRLDFGHMVYEATYEDSEMLTAPIHLSVRANYIADSDMLENVCSEGNRDKVHMVGSGGPGVSVSRAALEKLVGTYEFESGSTVVSGFMGNRQKVNLVDGRLYLNALPMIPTSDTTFESTGAAARFVFDSNGKAAQLVLGQTEGDARYARK